MGLINSDPKSKMQGSVTRLGARILPLNDNQSTTIFLSYIFNHLNQRKNNSKGGRKFMYVRERGKRLGAAECRGLKPHSQDEGSSEVQVPTGLHISNSFFLLNLSSQFTIKHIILHAFYLSFFP